MRKENIKFLNKFSHKTCFDYALYKCDVHEHILLFTKRFTFKYLYFDIETDNSNYFSVFTFYFCLKLAHVCDTQRSEGTIQIKKKKQHSIPLKLF